MTGRGLRSCLLGQAHPRQSLDWTRPVHDSREWMRVLGGGDVLSYQRAIARPESLRNYDLAIVELTPATHRLPALLRRRVPGLVCLGLIEGRVEYVVRSAHEMEGLFQFTKALAEFDLIGVLVERTVPYYRLYVERSERVQWLGIPYPRDWTDGFPWIPLEDRPLVVELGSALDSRNGIANVLVLKELQRRFPEVRGRIFYCSPRERAMLEELRVRAELLQPRGWQDYWVRTLRNTFALLCLDDRRTWGRYALDCAAAGVAFVGSHLSHAGELVGAFTCDPFDTEKALAYLTSLVEERLRGDDEIYRDAVARQYEGLSRYGGDAARERLGRAFEAAGLERLATELRETPPPPSERAGERASCAGRA